MAVQKCVRVFKDYAESFAECATCDIKNDQAYTFYNIDHNHICELNHLMLFHSLNNQTFIDALGMH
jgi:hypothetical protein